MTGLTSLLRNGFAALVLGALAIPTTGGGARAADLTIGVRAAPESTDPHWMTAPVMFQVNSMVFEPMLKRDDDAKPQPLLATSWETPNDTTWIFHLRKDVKWQDGSPFTAEDVKFTYARAGNVPNAPTSFKTYVNQIKEVEVVDPYTLKITTTEPAPSLLEKLVYILIVSKKYGEHATTDDYNSGKAMIGTGPYKFVSWVHNATTILQRNDDYWGGKQPWEKVTYKVIPNDSTRLAALLAGDIDIMEIVPAKEVERLKKNPNIVLVSKLTPKVGYYTFDLKNGLKSGKITGPNGETLTEDPLANPDVRAAMEMAIDRNSLVEHFFGDQAVAAAQYLPPGSDGYNPSIKVVKGDPAKAKAMLQKAGWAGKFKIEIVTAPELAENIVPVAEGLAQIWTQIGIPTRVSAMPYAVLVKERNEGHIAVTVSAYQNSTGSAENFYPTLVHSRDPAHGFGVLNSYNYSNKQVDALIEQAYSTMDEAKRTKLWNEVTKLAVADQQMVALFHIVGTHAVRKGIRFIPRVDYQVLATNAFPADQPATSAKPVKK